MFLASKLFWLLAQPLSLIFVLIFLSVLFASAGLKALHAVLVGIAMSLFFFTLFTTSGTVMLQTLENRFPRAALPADLSCIIILGGAFENEVIASRGGVEINQAGDRFIEAARLARLYPAARLVISGGDGSFSGDYPGDAETARTFFPEFGIAAERLIAEDTSRTTLENTENTKAVLQRNGLANCALITSAFHMPRAVGLFRKLGVAVLAWPTDYRTTGTALMGPGFSQPSLNAQLTTTAVREWVGLFAAYIIGRTHTVFPG